MRRRVKIEQVSALEEQLTDYFNALKAVHTALERWQFSLDTERPVAERHLVQAWHDIGKIMSDTPSVTKLLVLAPVLKALHAANQVAVAEHDCNLGREGCEVRWDVATLNLRKALKGIDFGDDNAPAVDSGDDVD